MRGSSAEGLSLGPPEQSLTQAVIPGDWGDGEGGWGQGSGKEGGSTPGCVVPLARIVRRGQERGKRSPAEEAPAWLQGTGSAVWTGNLRLQLLELDLGQGAWAPGSNSMSPPHTSHPGGNTCWRRAEGVLESESRSGAPLLQSKRRTEKPRQEKP